MAERPTRAELRQRVYDNNLRSLLLENQTFRYFLWTLFVDAGIFYPSFTRGSMIDTAYWAGRQSLGLEMLHRLKNLTPGVIGLLEREGDLFTAPPGNPERAATPNQQSEDPEDDDPYAELS